MSAPANETGTLSYNVLYDGSMYLVSTTFVAGISWGFMTSLYAVCMHSLIRNLGSTNASRKTVLLAVWVTILWISSSLSTFANAYCTLYAYSWELDYLGGPRAYLDDAWDQPVPTLAYTTYAMTMWFADALMLWRLVIFYSYVRPLTRSFIFSFMFLIYFGTVGAACFAFVLASSNRTLYSSLGKSAAIPFFALSVVLNVLATALITIRLLKFRRLLERCLGKEQARKSPYTSIATMLMESSALYAIWSLVYIIVYALSNPGQYIMLMTLGNVQVIAPLLIVYRVSRGTAWEETTSAKLTSVESKPVFYNSPSESNTIITTQMSERQGSSDSSQMIFENASQVESTATSV